MTFKFQNVTVETNETLGIANAEIQFCSLYRSRRKEKFFEIILFYFEMS